MNYCSNSLELFVYKLMTRVPVIMSVVLPAAGHTHTLFLSLSHTHTHTHTHTHKHMHTQTHTLSLSLTLTHTHTHTQLCMHTHTYTLRYTDTLTYKHTHTHTHTHKNTDRRTHGHIINDKHPSMHRQSKTSCISTLFLDNIWKRTEAHWQVKPFILMNNNTLLTNSWT